MASTPPTYTTIKVLKLPRLPVGWKDQPQLFERYWDEAMSSIEKTLNGLLVLPEIQMALAAAQQATQQALAAASAASGAASDAQSVAAAQAKEASLVNSYPQPIGSTAVVTASSDGVVTIGTHTRVYGDTTLNPSVTVNGGTLTTTATAGQIDRDYYSDPERDGGTVTYQYTVDPAVSPAQGVDIHAVGAVSIPTTGTTPGRTPAKPGYVDYQNNQ